MIVAKFGGSSLADAERFRHVAEILLSDPRRSYAVVSAPGKRFDGDVKVTDLLYRYHESRNEDDLAAIGQRFQQIIDELGISLDLTDALEKIRNAPEEPDFLASRGEYLSARILAACLGWPFVDAADCVFFDDDGSLDISRTRSAIFEALRQLPHAVLPGFYGSATDGSIRTFTRGGSDISGALVAGAMDADVYENWTDVDGMRVTDPRIIPNAAPIRSITYRELRELAYHGATVLHEASVLPVRQAGIPIHIRNTFQPEAEGSRIIPANPEAADVITGIAGRTGYSSIQIEREDTNSMVGYVRRILSCLENRQISFEHLATGVGSVCLVVPTESIVHCREELKRDIERAVHPDSLIIRDHLAMIAVVGRGMVNRYGVCARLFDAVGRIGVSVRVIDQGSTEMNIVVGVDEQDYENTLRAIHAEFFE